MGDDVLVNLSVWENVTALSDFVYRSGHVEIMRRRLEWFERMAEVYVVLWWVSKTRLPSMEEAMLKLAHLRQHGPTPEAFTFRSAFPAPDAVDSTSPTVFPDECPAT